MSKETRQLVLEMCTGVLGFDLIFGLTAAAVSAGTGYQPLPIILGFLVGAMMALAMLIHMAVITERVLDSRDEAYASRTTVIHSVIRKLAFMAVLILIVVKIPQINALAAVAGTMGLKAGAYLQPFIHRFREPKVR